MTILSHADALVPGDAQPPIAGAELISSPISVTSRCSGRDGSRARSPTRLLDAERDGWSSGVATRRFAITNRERRGALAHQSAW